MPTETAPAKSAAPAPYTRANPFPARLKVNRRLSSEDSEKDTRHFELDLTGWGLSYEVGDSVAVYPTNDPALVDAVASFSVMTHFDGLQKGIIDSRDVLFYFSVIGFCLFTTGAIIRTHRAG